MKAEFHPNGKLLMLNTSTCDCEDYSTHCEQKKIMSCREDSSFEEYVEVWPACYTGGRFWSAVARLRDCKYSLQSKTVSPQANVWTVRWLQEQTATIRQRDGCTCEMPSRDETVKVRKDGDLQTLSKPNEGVVMIIVTDR